MKNFTFKYYPPKVLIIILILVLSLIVIGKWSIYTYLFEKQADFWDILIYLLSSSAIISALFFFLNQYGLNKLTAILLDIPDLRGNYEGKLTSNYHVDDDPNKPKITKHIHFEISQNLNGFHIKAIFSDTRKSSNSSSTASSLTHNIESLPNGKFLITYQYMNEPDKTHKDEKKYGLNLHRGIAELIYNPKEKTLKGNYWNNIKDRESYGTIHLNKT